MVKSTGKKMFQSIIKLVIDSGNYQEPGFPECPIWEKVERSEFGKESRAQIMAIF